MNFNPQPKHAIKIVRKSKAWEMLVEKVYDRDLYYCQICGWMCEKHQLHPHHIIPTGRLRIDHIDNLLTVCPICHRKIHDHLDGLSVDGVIEDYPRVKKFLEAK